MASCRWSRRSTRMSILRIRYTFRTLRCQSPSGPLCRFLRPVGKVNREDPVLVGRLLPAIQTYKLFYVLLVAVPYNERMDDDLALDLGNPIADILNIRHHKQLSF